MDLGPYIELGMHDQTEDLVCKAVAVRIVGRSVSWVDRFGFFHQSAWDPARDEITVTIPPCR